MSVMLPIHTLLLACVYGLLGSCTITICLEEFMGFSGFLSSSSCVFYIYGDSNIHVDVAYGDDHKIYDPP